MNITNLTKKKTPAIPWEKIKEKVLGKKYEISVVLANSKKMKKLNKDYRKKNSAADTLSFVFSKNEGEIFLNASNTKRGLLFLFIHSLLHLKGMKHGKDMEKKENLYYNQYHGS